MQDDPKLPDDSGEYPKPNGVVESLILDCEIFFLLDARTSQVATRLYVPKKKSNLH